MIKCVSFFFLMFVFSASVSGQSMVTVFKNLPTDCTPDLSHKQRTKLIKDGILNLTDKGSTETIQYSLDTTESQKGYLKYENTYITGPSGFVSFELRRFKSESGRDLIVFSECGGSPTNYSQQVIRIFEVKEKGELSEDLDQSLLPLNFKLETFLKEQTPDNIKARTKQIICSCYDLKLKKTNDIIYKNWPAYEPEPGDDKWILGYNMKLHWTGKAFEKNVVLKTQN